MEDNLFTHPPKFWKAFSASQAKMLVLDMRPMFDSTTWVSSLALLEAAFIALEGDGKECIYRMELHPDGSVGVTSFDYIEGFTSDLLDVYETIDKLPQWAQDRLAVLMILDADKPPMPTVPNVGRRISRDVFWIIKGNGELASHG